MGEEKKFPGTLFLGTFFFFILGGFSPSEIARQLSGKSCLAAIFASRHLDASPGPLGREALLLGFGKAVLAIF